MPEFHEIECKKCGFWWPEDGYSFFKSGPRSGYRRPTCRRCHAAAIKKIRLADPVRRKSKRREQTYGLTKLVFEQMLADQGHLCCICLEKPATDVDHREQEIRGVLCRGCNLMIGKGREDPGILRRAADYVSLDGFLAGYYDLPTVPEKHRHRRRKANA